jgi:sugar phosphate isomerase/epimerase
VRLSCADFTFPLLKHEQSLDLISSLEFEGVDIGLFEQRGHLWPSREFRNLPKHASALKRKLDDRGLKLADLFLQTAPEFESLAPNHPDKKIRARARDIFLRAVEYAARCGGKHLTALPGTRWKHESLTTSLSRCADELSWRCEAARRAGLTFSIEAHLGSIAPTPTLALELLRRTPELTLTLDYGHFAYQGFRDEIAPLVARASHFHARCGTWKRLQSVFKENTIDFGQIIQAMKRTRYRGWICLEYVWVDWQHCNEVDNVSETILLREHLKELFNHDDL